MKMKNRRFEAKNDVDVDDHTNSFMPFFSILRYNGFDYWAYQDIDGTWIHGICNIMHT